MSALLKYSSAIIILCLISCTDPVISDPPPTQIVDKLHITTDINYGYWGTSGASGYFNDSLFSFGYVGYVESSNGENKVNLVLQRSIWYEDIIWAIRENLSTFRLQTSQTMGADTIDLPVFESFSNYEGLISLTDVYFDGDAAAECYGVFDEEKENRIIISEKNFEANTIAGNMNLTLEINEACPPKYDPSKPDVYEIKDLNFRARLR